MQAIIEQMPMILLMMDLYGGKCTTTMALMRFLGMTCALTDMRSEILHTWAPGGSLVIIYAQNVGRFERQHLNPIDSGIEVFENTGDVDVMFEVMDE